MTETIDAVRAAFATAYSVEREVGQGGMATVYLAHDLKHDRQVALKVLRPELAAAMGGDRFPREIQIIAQLSHPHILPLYDSGEMGGFLFYVMPYVEGESLRQKLDREGPLPVAETVRIVREVADALAYAHGRGIVHRDIKPDNVMLSGRHAIVTDFGVAKAVSAASGQQLTTMGVALGTPAYMSPEQAMGETDIDQRSDIYAVGILTYEMLTGETPFKRPTPQAVLSAHVLEPPDDIVGKRSDVSPVLGEVVMRCLRKERGDRWQTAEQMLPLLEVAATPSGGMTPTFTRPVSALRPRPRRYRRVLGAIAAVAVVVAGAVGGSMLFRGSGAPGPERMAVLPIRDSSGQDAQLAQVMQENLIVELGQQPGLTVAPSSAMEIYRSQPKPSSEIAQELNVGALLEGQVFRAGQRLRITLQLTDPRSIAQIWSESYDIDMSGDLFQAVDGVIPQIADGVRRAVTADTTSSRGDR